MTLGSQVQKKADKMGEELLSDGTQENDTGFWESLTRYTTGFLSSLTRYTVSVALCALTRPDLV